MKHQRDDYNKRIQDAAGIIPADEPVMLFRAQDQHAPAVLRHYAFLLRKHGQYDMADQVAEHVLAMHEWQEKNDGKVKKPDTPVQLVMSL